MKPLYFYLFSIFYSIVVVTLATTTPISPHEAKLFFHPSSSSTFLSFLMHLELFPSMAFLSLRWVSILFGFFSISLFYQLTFFYLGDKKAYRYTATAIFMLLPGLLTAMVLSNIAIIVLSFVLLFLWLYHHQKRLFFPFVFLIIFFLHNASIIFFSAIFLYAIDAKEKDLLLESTLLIVASWFFHQGIPIGGVPSGHFLEVFGLYMSLFSPFLFLYFFYFLYRRLLYKKKSLIWYISFTALLFSLLLSIRQRIHIADFAPYMLIALLPMFEFFYQQRSLRLPQFQKSYKRGFYIVLIGLFFSTSMIMSHQIIFSYIPSFRRYFAKKIYFPFELAQQLKEKRVTCVDESFSKIDLQLEYYGISFCPKK